MCLYIGINLKGKSGEIPAQGRYCDQLCCKSDCFAVLLVLNSADTPEDITTGYNAAAYLNTAKTIVFAY